MAVSDYKTVPDQNTTISGINIAEGCPPSGINNAIRQMMADIKAKDDAQDTATSEAKSAADNAKTSADAKLPLAGGRMTGGVGWIYNNVLHGYLNSIGIGMRLKAGEFGYNYNGAYLELLCDDSGAFRIFANKNTDNASEETRTSCLLEGYTNGTLKWGGNSVLTTANGMLLTGGTMSGTVVHSNAEAVRSSTTNSQVGFTACPSGYVDGARLVLHGKDRSVDPGCFVLSTGDGTSNKKLIGKPDGTLQWDGQNIRQFYFSYFEKDVSAGSVSVYFSWTVPSGWNAMPIRTLSRGWVTGGEFPSTSTTSVNNATYYFTVIPDVAAKAGIMVMFYR